MYRLVILLVKLTQYKCYYSRCCQGWIQQQVLKKVQTEAKRNLYLPSQSEAQSLTNDQMFHDKYDVFYNRTPNNALNYV